MEMTKEQIVQALLNCKTAIKYIKNNKSLWYEIVGDCDKAFCDIRHQIENNYPTDRKDKTKAVQMIYDYAKERRKNKDLLTIFGHIAQLDDRTINDLFRAINNVKADYDRANMERTYRNRILDKNELW